MFSIIIPLYNKEKQIVNTIKSVLSQTFQEFEIVVVNDGSTDNSIKELSKIDNKRIKLINQLNGGVASARNTGIQNATFQYIAFLDADDQWEKDYLETVRNMIIDYPTCEVFATNYKIVDTKGKERFPVDTNLAFFTKTKDNKSGILEDYFYFASRTAPPLCASAVICKKDAIENIGGFPLNIKSAEDLITWAKLGTFYSLCYSKEIKSIYNVEIQNYEEGRMIDKNNYIEKELIKLIPFYKSKKSIKMYLSLWFKMRASTFLRNNHKLESLKEIFKSIYYNFRNYKVYLYLIILIVPKYFYKYIFK